VAGDVTAYRFYGSERVTIELDGWFAPGGLAVPRRLGLDLDDQGRGRVRLFAFHVADLRITGVPLVRSSYAELLWRVAVRARGRAAWWVAACDLGARGPRLLAARYVRYPVRAQQVEVTGDRVQSSGAAGTLALAVAPAGREELVPEVRPLVVGAGAQWQVPWGDDAAPGRTAAITVGTDSLSAATLGGPVTWARSALLRVNREHRCGVAVEW
jgi:hypothetical protein